ncbi:MAG: AAA family ATPase, partial [Oscillochloris sp.]|nr:AAA family ATPase [Oscillochloris sp.]
MQHIPPPQHHSPPTPQSAPHLIGALPGALACAPPNGEPQPGHEYLLLALARLDILLHRQIARRQQSEGEQRDTGARTFYLSSREAFALLQPPAGVGAQRLDDEEDYDMALAHADEVLAAAVHTAQRTGRQLPLHDLAELFALTPFARDLLLISLAPALDLRYGTIYAYLQDDLTRRWPTINLILDLLCPPGAERLGQLTHIIASAPLRQRHLIDLLPPTSGVAPPLLAHAVRSDESLALWLMTGRYDPRPELAGHLAYTSKPSADPALLAVIPLAELQRSTTDGTLFSLHGPDAYARNTAIDALAAALGRPLLRLDLGGLLGAGLDAQTGLALALRDALLTQACLAILGWEACLDHGVPDPAFLAPLLDHPGPVIISGQQPWHAQGIARTRRISWIHIPAPNHLQREQLFAHYLATSGVACPIPARLTRQFLLTSEQIRDIVESGRDTAAQEGQPLSEEYLFRAARDHSSLHLNTLARKAAARYCLTDLVVSADQQAHLRELINMIRYRSQVLDEWGVGKKLAASGGITALFAGPPGTGKTMAAEVIAAEVGLDMYKINLSAVVSKYIGETEKNLEQIF